MLLISGEKYSRRKQQLYQKNTGQEQRELVELSGWPKWLALGWCWLLVTLGFLLPSLVLIDYLITYFDTSWNTELFEYGLNSLLVSGSAAVVACFIALFMGVYQRLKNSTFSKIPASLVSTGYAMPGNVLAIGVLIPPDTFRSFH